MDLSTRFVTFPVSFLLWAHMDSDTEVKRGRKWWSERARMRSFWSKQREIAKEKSRACSLPHLFFFSLHSVCGSSHCSSETPASSEWRWCFLAVSLLRERSSLSGFHPSLGRRQKNNLISPSKAFSFPFVFSSIHLACWLNLLFTLKIPSLLF